MSMGRSATTDEVLAAQTARVAARRGRGPDVEDYAAVYRRLGLPEEQVRDAAERRAAEAATRQLAS